MIYYFRGKKFDTSYSFLGQDNIEIIKKSIKDNNLDVKNARVYKCIMTNSILLVLSFGLSNGVVLKDARLAGLEIGFYGVNFTYFSSKNTWEIYGDEKLILNELGINNGFST